MKLKSLRAQHAVVACFDWRGRAGVIATLTATMMIAASGVGLASGDPVRGERVYRNCMACHALNKNDVGPMHDGVFGNKWDCRVAKHVSHACHDLVMKRARLRYRVPSTPIIGDTNRGRASQAKNLLATR